MACCSLILDCYLLNSFEEDFGRLNDVFNHLNESSPCLIESLLLFIQGLNLHVSKNPTRSLGMRLSFPFLRAILYSFIYHFFASIVVVWNLKVSKCVFKSTKLNTTFFVLKKIVKHI
ncbi:hypothetical protein HPP92_025521 [Vanilla planifolia]|uniref:Uncharacterized protein n=1 Tax=Vanilla planifolia TaxID=51239 RepID=A0A835U905_VANPL|nr:hypothetical protein HPP92_025521 [Vanilla planifolia]